MKALMNYKKVKIQSLLLISLVCCQLPVYAANLLEVYQQAQTSDPIFQQAVAQRLSTKEGVPVSVAALLPNLSVSANPTVTRYGYAGSNYVSVTNNSPNYVAPRNLTQRAYTLDLTLTQTVFNFAQFATVAGQIALSKSADATLNAALQDLMMRVSGAYFTILKDEDNVSYNEATKRAYAEQLRQMTLQYKAGIKTLTDVYTAQASYDSSNASLIAAQTTLANDRENLRVITGVYYPHLAKLGNHFPLVKPQPADMEKWVQTSLRQNWTIKSAQYNADSIKQTIKQQFAGHLPTIQLEGSFERQYTQNINAYQSFNQRNGPGTVSERQIGFNINMPLFEGGSVVAQTNQAMYNYEMAQQQLEQTIRGTMGTTRQSYMTVVAGISQVKADEETIKSTISSLHGLEASYQAGIETLVNVLSQQEKVYQAQTQYATDRYAFITNLLTLKQSAGTLSFNDLRAVNNWLS